MSEEIKNNAEEKVDEIITTNKRGRKPVDKKEFSTEDIQSVLQTPEAQAIMQDMVAKQ